MSDEDMAKFEKKKTKAAVRGKVYFEGMLYPSLYKLAEEFYKKMSEHADLFPRLPTQTNKTKAIHSIGKMIAKRRVSVARSDVHGLPFGEVDLELFNSDEYATMNELFVLPQRDIVQHCNLNYGKAAETRKPTTDDKVRAVGIVMTNDDVRQLLPDMLGKSKGGTRTELDAASSKSRRGFHMLHEKFVDKEVIVKLPEKWEDPDTARKVDERLGAGVFEEHAQFDPNNESRIAMAWQLKEVQGVFQLAAKEYQSMMDKYMMGTGGGDGDDANFSNWWERDETRTATYINGQNSNLYLSLMYMWDKSYNFVFVEKRDPLPGHMGIGDIYNGDNDNGDGELEFDAVSSYGQSSMTTPKSRGGSPGFGKSSSDLAEMLSTMRHMVTARNAASEAQKEILELLKRDRESSDGADINGGGTMMNSIKQTQRVINNFESDLTALKAKKQKLVNNGGGTNDENAEKIEKLKTSIKDTKHMLKVTRGQLKRQIDAMGSMFKSGDDSLASSDDSD